MNRWSAVVVALVAALGLVVACGGGGGVSVAVSPSAVTLAPGASQTFMASVRGARDASLEWSASGGHLVPSGSTAVFTAPAADGDYTVTARSVQDRGRSASATVTVRGTREAGLTRLPGASDDSAASAAVPFEAPIVIDETVVSVVGEGDAAYEVLRTELRVVFTRGATIADVNALLDDLDGAIVSMTRGQAAFVIRVADPGDLEALRALQAAIEARPEVVAVGLGVMLDPSEEPAALASETQRTWLPPDVACTRDEAVGCSWLDLRAIEHHLAVRAPALWNLRHLATGAPSAPALVIADSFGGGVPNEHFAGTFEADDFGDADPRAHGYHVLGIAIGTHEHVAVADRAQVKGIYPGTLHVRAFDLRAGGVTVARWRDGILNRLDAVLTAGTGTPRDGARVVLNTSLNTKQLPADELELEAILWHRAMADGGLEDRVVHVTSAGNDNSARLGRIRAPQNSFFAAAALLELVDLETLTIREPLRNTLVVENRRIAYEDPAVRPRPSCLSEGSYAGGSVSAPGYAYSFRGADAGAARGGGTSYATPQVGGLAAMLWAIAPDLTGPQVRDVLLATTRTEGFAAADDAAACAPEAGAPVIDAFDAVLRVGGAQARRALLDANGDGRFDEDDVQLFLAAFAARGGALDYSRYDLNGSGTTGGERRERFDLNMDGQYGNLQFTFDAVIDGRDLVVTVGVHESRVTDLDILCYYVFDAANALFDGDRDVVRQHLSGACATGALPTIDVAVSVDPSSVALVPGAEQAFTATVTGTNDTGVTWTATCGTLSGGGTSVIYTAPPTVPAGGTCTVTATSDAEPSASASATVTLEDWTLDLRIGWGPGITDPDIVDMVPIWEESASTVERSLTVVWPEIVVYVSLRRGTHTPEHDVPVTITRDGRPLDGKPVYPAGAAWHVFYFFHGYPDAGAGTYEARAAVDGRTLHASRVYASPALTEPSGVTLHPSGRLVQPPNQLDIGWSPVPGAVRYTAAGSRFTALGAFDVTTRASVAATARSARVGGASIGWHHGRVTAFEWDPTLPRGQPYPEPVPETFRSATAFSAQGLEVGRRLAIQRLTDGSQYLGEDRRVGRIDIEPGVGYCLINTTDFFDECTVNFADGEIVTLTYDGDAFWGSDPTDLVAWGGDCAAFGSQPVCVLTMHRDMEVSVEIDFR